METQAYSDFLSEYFQIGLFLFLILLGYIVGSFNERRHYSSIKSREKDLLRLPATTSKVALENDDINRAWLVCGNVVISNDYFKRIAAGLRNIFGGRVTSYESLVDRARREALLRMKEQAEGANIIVNVRIETSSIGKNANGKKAVASVEALAYGTAVWLKPQTSNEKFQPRFQQ